MIIVDCLLRLAEMHHDAGPCVKGLLSSHDAKLPGVCHKRSEGVHQHLGSDE